METKVLLKVCNLKKYFDLRETILESFFSKKGRYLKAVDGIDLDIRDGEIFSLVGESGCGKTTTGRLIMNSIKPTSGEVYFDNIDIFSIKNREEKKQMALKMQMIFQDPYEYLSPWLNVHRTLAEPLRIHNLVENKDEELSKIIEIMNIVNLTPVNMILPKHSYELSGGQRQRVIVARALLLNPKFIVADEPVSMIDISLRIGILNLLLSLRDEYSITILFITHDIAIARYMSDRIGVMYLGKIIEKGPTDTIINKPLHPYTQALIAAVPVPDPSIKTQRNLIKGRITSAIDLPLGCRFAPRCIYSKNICLKEEPELRKIGEKHFVSCHLYNGENNDEI